MRDPPPLRVGGVEHGGLFRLLDLQLIAGFEFEVAEAPPPPPPIAVLPQTASRLPLLLLVGLALIALGAALRLAPR